MVAAARKELVLVAVEPQRHHGILLLFCLFFVSKWTGKKIYVKWEKVVSRNPYRTPTLHRSNGDLSGGCGSPLPALGPLSGPTQYALGWMD